MAYWFSPYQSARTDKHQNGVLSCLKFGIIPVCADTICRTSYIMAYIMVIVPQRDSLSTDLDKDVAF